jgi:hypothetical protein
MGLSFVGNPNPRHAYKNVYLAYQKTIVGLFWLHMQLWVYAYQIYTILVYHINHPKVGMKAIIVAP